LVARAFGLDVASLKGKTTRNKPAPAVSNLVEIPDELLETHQDVTISMDGWTANSLMFLSTISHDIYYSTAQNVSQPNASVYKKCLVLFLVLLVLLGHFRSFMILIMSNNNHLSR